MIVGEKVSKLIIELDGVCNYINPKEDEEIIYESKYFGDHQENWFIYRKKSGQRIADFNATKISCVDYEPLTKES